jgi:hypothetical protein
VTTPNITQISPEAMLSDEVRQCHEALMSALAAFEHEQAVKPAEYPRTVSHETGFRHAALNGIDAARRQAVDRDYSGARRTLEEVVRVLGSVVPIAHERDKLDAALAQAKKGGSDAKE